MPNGQLFCPKCKTAGMGQNSYLYYESRVYKDQEGFIFYNRVTIENKWKCWALVEECGCMVKNYFDPFGWCFNPCDHTPDVITYVNNKPVRKNKDFFCGLLLCMLYFCVIAIIIYMYALIFFWYDLYHCFCKKEKIIKIIYTGKEEVSYSEDEDYGLDIKRNFSTEDYWCKHFPDLFKCKKCNYQGKTFKEFMDINQIAEHPVEIVNTQMDETNAGIKI